MGDSRPRLVAPANVVRLLEEDPELADHATGARFERASRRLLAETFVLPRGEWPALTDSASERAQLGLLVVRGALARRVVVGGRRSAELFGRGDLIKPAEADANAVIAEHASWDVLVPTRLAVLDRELTARAAAFPGILPALATRLAARSRSLALRLAIAQIPSLEERLEVLLWHLAERWGVRGPDAVVLELPLTQQMLAELTCARRTSVCAAMRALVGRGRVGRRPGRRLALLGSPPRPFAAAGSSC